MKLLGAALVLSVVTALGGCGVESPPGPAPDSGVQVEERTPVADPTAITIPKLGVHSTLIPLGLGPDGELAVPPVDRPLVAGWYAGADIHRSGDEIAPGEVGPAIVAGHVDGIVNGRKGQPGIFARLPELAPGDEIVIDRADGSTITFEVYAVERHAKDAFPSGRVYDATTMPELRLVTCGGAFDRVSGHYVDNWIVWARQAPRA